MGFTLLFCNGTTRNSPSMHKPYWLGAILCNAFIVKLIDEKYSVLSIPSFLFIIGVFLTLSSLFSLGKSFAVTPMLCNIKTKKCYSYVRHPMYLGESIIMLSCLLATKSPVSIFIYILYLFYTIKRIHEEECLLLKAHKYQEYCKCTPWNFFSIYLVTKL